WVARPKPAPRMAEIVRPEPAVAASISDRPAPATSATASAHAAPSRGPSLERSQRHPETPAPSLREVTFLIIPKGALVSIDDAPPEELFLKTKKLSVGLHSFRAQVPAPSNCCEPLK